MALDQLLDLCGLDYIWRGLSAGLLSSSVFLLAMAAAPRLIRGGSAWAWKWFYNFHYLAAIAVFVGGFFYLAAVDRELANGCFRDYVKEQGPFMVTRFVAEVWFVVSIVLLTWDAVRIVTAGVLARSRLRHCHNRGIVAMVNNLRIRMGIRNDVPIFSTEQTVSPYVFGFLRPVIILPQSFNDSAPKSRESILAHELVHVRDRDGVWLILAWVLRRLLFFHPLIYIVDREYEVCVERAADEGAVLKGGIGARHLAQALLEAASASRVTVRQPWALSVTRGFYQIRARLESLAQLSNPRGSKPVALTLFLISLLSLLGSLAQTGSAAVKVKEQDRIEGRMCRQVQHEQQIESWLKMRDPSNRCEP